ARDIPAARLRRIDDVRVAGSGHTVAPIAPVHRKPVLGRIRVAPQIVRWPIPYAQVLQAPAHIEWDAVIDADLIELRQRHVLETPPGLAAVFRKIHASVIALHHALRILRIYP